MIDTAELIARANACVTAREANFYLIRELASALSAQAQEIATAQTNIVSLHLELAAEKHCNKKDNEYLLAERDAIEEKTIERCAKLMESDDFGWGDAAAAIRALQSHG